MASSSVLSPHSEVGILIFVCLLTLATSLDGFERFLDQSEQDEFDEGQDDSRDDDSGSAERGEKRVEGRVSKRYPRHDGPAARHCDLGFGRRRKACEREAPQRCESGKERVGGR